MDKQMQIYVKLKFNLRLDLCLVDTLKPRA